MFNKIVKIVSITALLLMWSAFLYFFLKGFVSLWTFVAALVASVILLLPILFDREKKGKSNEEN